MWICPANRRRKNPPRGGKGGEYFLRKIDYERQNTLSNLAIEYSIITLKILDLKSLRSYS